MARRLPRASIPMAASTPSMMRIAAIIDPPSSSAKRAREIERISLIRTHRPHYYLQRLQHGCTPRFRNSIKHACKFGTSGFRKISSHLLSSVREAQLSRATILRATGAGYPPTRLQDTNQPTDGALLELQTGREIVLGQRHTVGEFHQRVRFGNCDGFAARCLVWPMQPEGAYQRNQLL